MRETRRMMFQWGHLHGGRSALGVAATLAVSLGACRVTQPAEILFERRGTAGLVTLNRPQALNAVTLAWCGPYAAVREWERRSRHHPHRYLAAARRAGVLGRRRYPRAL